MKFLIIILVLSTLVSCGKKSTTKYVTGTQGEKGNNCYVETLTNGSRITCEDGSRSDVLNGTNGTKGDKGQDGMDGEDGTFTGILEYVEVCPLNQPATQYKETLVKLDGIYLAFLSSNSYTNQRLVQLPEDVEFTTTDGRNVKFKIVNEIITCLN